MPIHVMDRISNVSNVSNVYNVSNEYNVYNESRMSPFESNMKQSKEMDKISWSCFEASQLGDVIASKRKIFLIG